MERAELVRDSGLSPEVWASISEALGEPDFQDVNVLGLVEPGDLSAAATAVGLRGLQRARLAGAYNRARAFHGLPATLLSASSETVAVVTASPGDATPRSTLDEGTVKDSLKVAHYFDQACKIEARPCSQDELLAMRSRWTKLMWTVPSRVQTMSDNQLSVLRRLLDRGHSMLAFDVSNWGPFSELRDRAFAMMAHHHFPQNPLTEINACVMKGSLWPVFPRSTDS